MALTAQQKEKLDEAKVTIEQIKSGLDQIQDVVYNSLAIQNVGGTHIYNIGAGLKPLFEKLNAQLDEMDNV